MTVIVKHEVMEIRHRQVPGVEVIGLPKSADTYWAECDECGKRSKGYAVGLFSAPNVHALEDAESHDCDLEGYFSTVEQGWARFKASLFAPAKIRKRRRALSASTTPEEP